MRCDDDNNALHALGVLGFEILRWPRVLKLSLQDSDVYRELLSTVALTWRL